MLKTGSEMFENEEFRRSVFKELSPAYGPAQSLCGNLLPIGFSFSGKD
jgi:hypothetical protein